MPLESDKLGGFKLQLREEIPTGLWPNNFSSRIPLWETGQNVTFTELGVAKIDGWETPFTATGSEPIRGIAQNLEGEDVKIYYADLSKIYQWIDGDASPTELATGFTGVEDGGSTVWDSGSTTWDSGSTLWDESAGIIATLWSMETYGSFVLATNGKDKPQIKKGNIDFVDLEDGSITGINITAGGSGYAAADPVTISGGGGSGATAEVNTVDGSGVILTIKITDSGSGYTSTPTATAGGSGSGATLTVDTPTEIDVTSILTFVKRNAHVLGFNTSADKREFIWCDADDPTDWVATASNTAGQLRIREFDSPIKAAVPLGDRVAVYAEDQMAIVTYVGGNSVFGYQPALNGVGAVSLAAVVPVGRLNYGLSKQGFFKTDGVSFQYIDQPQIREYYQANVNLGQISKANGYHVEAKNEVRWYFPSSTTDTDTGLTYNYRTGNWSIITEGRSATSERNVFSFPVVGAEDGSIQFEDKSDNLNGGALEAWVRTKPVDLDDPEVMKEVDSIRLGAQSTGMQFRLGYSNEEDTTPTWQPYQNINTGYTNHNVRVAGRYLFLEVYSNTLNASWELSSMDVIGRKEGTR